jgi:predicted thioesterase
MKPIVAKLERVLQTKVKSEDCWDQIEENAPRVASTSALIAYIHRTAIDLLSSFTDENEINVSEATDIMHLGIAPFGSTITIKVWVEKVRNNNILLKFEVYDEFEKIAYGRNRRKIISRAYLDRKIREKNIR